MEGARNEGDMPRLRLVSSEVELEIEEQEEFDEDVLEAFRKLGFRLGKNNEIVKSPRFVWYNILKAPARVLGVLTDKKSRVDDAPVLELRTQPKDERKEKLFKLPVTSMWLEKFEKE